MKLSEAIRLGALFVEEDRQVFMLNWRRGGGRGKCGCALGTGAFAVGAFAGADLSDITVKSFCAVFPEYSFQILKEVSARHAGGESRLSIADWLESEIEPALFPAQETTQQQEKEPERAFVGF